MSRKFLLIFLYLYALVFSVLKAIRLPGEWAKSHWLMDYRFGFIKRGLAGEVLGWFFNKSELSLVILCSLILFLLYTFLFRIALKETFKREKSLYTILFFLIFFLSQHVIFSGHLIGYFDHVVFLLTILVIYLVKQRKFFLSSVIAGSGIFIHEISLLLLLPVSCFALIVFESQDEKFVWKDIFSPHIFKKLFVFLGLPFAAILSVSFFQETGTENNFPAIFNYLKQNGIDTDVADSVSSAYTKSFTHYLKEESPHFIQRLFISTCTIFNGIPILFLLWMIFKIFKLKHNFQLFLLLAIVSFVPLLLHIIAFDTYRIWTFPYMILFLGFWILSSKFSLKKVRTGKLSIIETVFFIISFLIIALVPTPLFDNEIERFSLLLRMIIIIPILVMLYFLKKPQSEKTEA